MSDEKLRDEALGWQAGVREISRWKLISIGGVAALGLGLAGPDGQPKIFVVCLIPFIAAYCDALHRDYDLRISTIGHYFFSRADSPYSEYEKFISTEQAWSSSWWVLGQSAVKYSSLAACMLTLVAGVYGLILDGATPRSFFLLLVTFVSAVTGAGLVLQVERMADRSYEILRRAAESSRNRPG